MIHGLIHHLFEIFSHVSLNENHFYVLYNDEKLLKYILQYKKKEYINFFHIYFTNK